MLCATWWRLGQFAKSFPYPINRPHAYIEALFWTKPHSISSKIRIESRSAAKLRVQRVVTCCPDSICPLVQVKTGTDGAFTLRQGFYLHVREARRVRRNQVRWLAEVGRLHQAERRIDDNFPYLLRVPENGKCQKKSWYQYIFFQGSSRSQSR